MTYFTGACGYSCSEELLLQLYLQVLMDPTVCEGNAEKNKTIETLIEHWKATGAFGSTSSDGGPCSLLSLKLGSAF